MKKLTIFIAAMTVFCSVGWSQSEDQGSSNYDLKPSTTDYEDLNYNSKGEYGKPDPKPSEPNTGIKTEYKVNDEISIGKTTPPARDERIYTEEEIREYRDNHPSGAGFTVTPR